jgi:UDP-2,4-diacetamido-2,4,6-trideoxy-beta-L-altropyranose hydrolase
VPQQPIVVFRVDGSAVMGSGHVKRCLALAQAMRELGAYVIFVSRPLDAAFDTFWVSADVPVRSLPGLDNPVQSQLTTADDPPHASWLGVDWHQDARETIECLNDLRPNWMVVDHYALDARWHRLVGSALGVQLVVIDDLADRPLHPHVLLDQNWSQDHSKKYFNRLNSEPVRLMGPRYALLSTQYRDAPRKARSEKVKSIGIFMGGTDVGAASAHAIQACRRAQFSGAIEVATTTANPHLHALSQACDLDTRAKLLVDEPNLLGFWSRHDLYIGAGGGATWERCCLAAPTIGVALARNQQAVIEELNNLGALLAAHMPNDDASCWPSLEQAVHQLLDDAPRRRSLAEVSGAMVDGYGALRVGLICVGENFYLQPASMSDAPLLFQWRNHPSVRNVSHDQRVIDLSEHLAWFERALSNAHRLIYVAKVGELVVGSIRFDQHSEDAYEVSLYTNPALTGLGLGKRMLNAGALALAERTAAKRITAQVVEGNEASTRLFAACGYHGGPYNFQKDLIR